MTSPVQRPPVSREAYIDAFRGLMVLVMVQGHLGDTLLSPETLAQPLYRLQQILHGTTAPGFLFASGFVAGLPRAPLSIRASLRRARRLLFVLGVGYALHLPYFSLWKTVAVASAAEKAALVACDALQVIAVTQLAVIGLQLLARSRWIAVAGATTAFLLAVGPAVWASGLSARVPPLLGAYLDSSTGSRFPVFPFSAFVLAGVVAGAALGRQDTVTRRRRTLAGGGALLAMGLLLGGLLAGRVDFWGVSPAYVLLRVGGLVLLLAAVEGVARREFPGVRAVALLGRETLLVYVLHLYLLFGGVLGPAPLGSFTARLGFGGAALALAAMIPVLLAAAWIWHRAKSRFPREASLLLAFLTVAFVYEFLTRPW
jgi:fucose 4-O-acetylase-like acetyltransferase